MWFERITVMCFGASYALALALELLFLFRPRPVLRLCATLLGGAGLLAHTLFLGHALLGSDQAPALASQFGSLLVLAWILAIFYVYGAIHHRKQAWGVFVLPVILLLVGLAATFPREEPEPSGPDWLRGERFMGMLHGALLLLAAVGVCVGFVASVMYLMQARRLRAKTLPGKGVRLLSLERLEAMNRHALATAFPLLTAGVLIGLVLMIPHLSELHSWTDPRILGAAVLWLVFALLVYLRYGYHVRGRRVALLTILAFVLMICTLASAHTIVQGGGP
jgi:ABC-type transport system involved in cytochrome c biogenesis permease subunit